MKDAPRIASWLLSHFGCSSNNEAVLGDLAEHYQDNQSRSWFWRQALVALVTGLRNEVSLHRLDATKALVLGWFVLSLSSFSIWSLFTGIVQLRRISEWLYRTEGVGLLGFLALTALLSCVATYTCGRLLARLFRPSHRAPLLLFAGSILVAVIVSIVTGYGTTETMISVNGLLSPTVTIWISPRFWMYALGNPLSLLGLLAGAGFFRHANRNPAARDASF